LSLTIVLVISGSSILTIVLLIKVVAPSPVASSLATKLSVTVIVFVIFVGDVCDMLPDDTHKHSVNVTSNLKRSKIWNIISEA